MIFTLTKYANKVSHIPTKQIPTERFLNKKSYTEYRQIVLKVGKFCSILFFC